MHLFDFCIFSPICGVFLGILGQFCLHVEGGNSAKFRVLNRLQNLNSALFGRIRQHPTLKKWWWKWGKAPSFLFFVEEIEVGKLWWICLKRNMAVLKGIIPSSPLKSYQARIGSRDLFLRLPTHPFSGVMSSLLNFGWGGITWESTRRIQLGIGENSRCVIFRYIILTTVQTTYKFKEIIYIYIIVCVYIYKYTYFCCIFNKLLVLFIGSFIGLKKQTAKPTQPRICGRSTGRVDSAWWCGIWRITTVWM